MKHLGQTRSALKPDHLLHTPDTFIRTQLPGMTNGVAIIHCGPALGARFTQYTAEFEPEGTLGPTAGQRFVYLLEGIASIETGNAKQELAAGGFGYFPESRVHLIRAKTRARLAVIEKNYVSVDGVASPLPIIGDEPSIPSQPFMGDNALQVRTLLPSDMRFDFAMNTMSFDPGASLSLVEVHVMEHGLLMLEGQGIYRLGDCWYPVQAGDFIWIRAFCPQWFGALGKTRTKYLLYKDWNRSPHL
jgi:(S)-ureidoglycine aminohydrolase